MARPMSLTPVSKEVTGKEPVYQGEATYYNPVTWKWQSGIFTLHRRHLEFLAEDEDINAPFHLTLPLCSISAIRKRASFFIYAALVIEVGCEAHWFSSFKNRDSVFNLLELFWRDALFSKSPSSVNSSTTKPQNLSLLGKQLLSMLHESEQTLVNTANELEEQGRQLHEAQEAIHDLNADLDAAEKCLKPNQSLGENLQSSSTSQEMQQNLQAAKRILNTKRRKFKVTFAREVKSDDSSIISWEKGSVVVADGFQLIDEQDNLKFQIPISEVQELIVVNPWELCIVQTLDNERIERYRIMCPALVQLHKILSMHQAFSEKMTYKDEANFPFRRPCTSSSSSTSSLSSAASPSSSVASLSPDIPVIIQQVQKVQSSGSLLQEEAQEISTVLENIQTLATEVNREQQCQMEKISQLIDDVNKTELRMNADNKTMRKMM